MRTKINQPPLANPGFTVIKVRQEVDSEAEAIDPFAMGWDAAADLDEPPPCPFKDGLKAKLWRQGFSKRVDAYIASVKSGGGINASIS
jgi:hypothetical protein